MFKIKIYCGYVTEEKVLKNANKIVENCVAIKFAYNHLQEQLVTNAIQILNAFQEIEESKRKHIIGMIDYGTSSSRPLEFENSYSVLVTELGQTNLHDYLTTNRQNEIYMDNTKINELISEMAQCLKEMHQVAVHLDFKPKNLVYVPTGPNATSRVLKLIDFDRAVIIPRNCEVCHEIEEEMVATDLFFEIDNLLNIGKYSSPETFVDNKKLSVKTDIWSFGISLYEVILLAKNGYIKKLENISKILDLIASLHRGFLVDEKGFKKQEINYNDNNWLQNNADFKEALIKILKVWKDRPKIALIIMSTLQVNSLDRITAIGIVDFLNDRCKPDIVKVETAENLQIFPNLTLGNLSEQILGLHQPKNCAPCINLAGKNNLHYLIGKVLRKIAKLFNEINSKDIESCDTKNVNFEL
ncbi:hypothetical protein GPALN_010570 [Globodera pallida]|nr:hypothetical protein GPALN_010570 [Globodera pallida]